MVKWQRVSSLNSHNLNGQKKNCWKYIIQIIKDQEMNISQIERVLSLYFLLLVIYFRINIDRNFGFEIGDCFSIYPPDQSTIE